MYLELHAKRKKRSWPEDQRVIRRELLPDWGGLLVTAIYDRSTYDREKQEALTMWGDRVEMIVRSRPSAQTG